MITTTLNVLKQTQHLGGTVSTGVYDDGELETMLETASGVSEPEIQGTQKLSPELLAQILSGGYESVRSGGLSEEENREKLFP